VVTAVAVIYAVAALATEMLEFCRVKNETARNGQLEYWSSEPHGAVRKHRTAICHTTTILIGIL
jgi:hypothetical protein